MAVKMNLEKCFCFNLDSAGLFIGWLGIIIHCIILIILAPCLIYYSFFYHDDVESGYDSGMFLSSLLLIFIFCIFCAWVSKSLIEGVRTRDSRLIKPWLLFFAMGTTAICIESFSGEFLCIPVAFFCFYICMYALHKKVQSEELAQRQGEIPYELAKAPILDVV